MIDAVILTDTQNGIITGSKDQTVKFWKFELVSSPEDDSGRYSSKVITDV